MQHIRDQKLAQARGGASHCPCSDEVVRGPIEEEDGNVCLAFVMPSLIAGGVEGSGACFIDRAPTCGDAQGRRNRRPKQGCDIERLLLTSR